MSAPAVSGAAGAPGAPGSAAGAPGSAAGASAAAGSMAGLLAAEARKMATYRPIGWVALAGAALPLLLTWLNGSGARADLAAGRGGWVTEDLGIIGSGELLLAAAASAAIGVLVVGTEYVALPELQGGGRQATTTALSVPHRGRVLAAKVLVAAAAVLVVALVAALGGLLVADRVLGEYAVPLDGERWGLGLRGAAYVALTGLLGLAVTAVLRNGLIPLIYLVGNSTVVSPSYLLTHVTDAAWYLPDTAAMTLMREPPDLGQPSALVGALVGAAWVAGFLALAMVLDRRRDA